MQNLRMPRWNPQCRLLKSQGEPISCELDRKWATLDKVAISGGCPMIKDGSSLLTAFTVKSKRVCQLICDFNRKCVGYKTLTASQTTCSIVEEGTVYEWVGSTIHTFNLYLNKMKQDLVLKTNVPRPSENIGRTTTDYFEYSFALNGVAAEKAANLKKCRQYCVNDPLCRAFKFGKCSSERVTCNNQMCYIFHNIANLPSEKLADTEFHFVAI